MIDFQQRYVKTLIRKELYLEWKRMASFTGILLYLVSTVFVCYLSFQGIIDPKTWNALFWIILMFACLNAVLKGFVQETEGRMIYYYSIVSPKVLIVSKIIYNAVFMTVLSLVGIVIYMAFMGNPMQHTALFVGNMVLGVVGFSSVMTLISAIVSRAKNNFTLMGILSFPLLLPLLLVLMKVSLASVVGTEIAIHYGNLFVIVLLTSITFVLSVILYPFIWKD